MSDSLLVRGGRIVDPSQEIDAVGDVLIRDGIVSSVSFGRQKSIALHDSTILEATGLVVSPGFIDLHCHLREPGSEEKETVATGALAAVNGGFTTLCVMPNTEPPLDTAPLIQFLRRRAKEVGLARLLPIACITRGREGRRLVEMSELVEAGAVGFSDDGDPVEDPFLMRMALMYSAPLRVPIIDHCQDPSLTQGGQVHEGWVASRLGLKGMPSAGEEVMAARDIELASLTGGHIHLAHISTSGTLDLVRNARIRGVDVTAEVTPQHLFLSEEAVLGQAPMAKETDPYAPLTPFAYDTRAKVNPPLRPRQDVQALIQGLQAGAIDAIATDHAPHNLVDKACPFDQAAFGISILETGVSMLLSLVARGSLELSTVVRYLTVGPARVMGPRWDRFGTLKPGAVGDVTIFDPSEKWVVNTDDFASRGKNSPLEGQTLQGKVVATVVAGKVVYDRSGIARGSR